MKVFFEGRLPNRRTPRDDVKQAPDKDVDMAALHLGGPEEFHQTQALIHALDTRFKELRRTLQSHRARLAQVHGALQELHTLLFPSKGRWWRRWFHW
jgi:hypothetical protein